MKTNFRRTVFCMAYELAKVTGKTFAVCLAKAWALHRLKCRMRTGTVSFAYEKADGTLRKARGTLRDIGQLVKGTGRSTYRTLRYFDADKEAFRSFRIENFITAY